MADVSPLLVYVTKQMELTKEEQDLFTSLLSVIKVKRKEFVYQPGFDPLFSPSVGSRVCLS